MSKYKAESILLFTTLIWGGTFAIIKNALPSVSPLVFLVLRFSIAALLLYPFLRNSLKGLSSSGIKDGVILGIFYFIGFVTQTIGLQYTTATKSGFITGSFVIFTPIFQFIIEKRAPGKGNILGILSVVIGLIFLSTRGDSLSSFFSEIGSDFNFGDFLTLICAISYSLYMVHLDIVSKRNDYKPLVFIQIVVTAVGAIILAGFFSVTNLQTEYLILNDEVIFAVLYTAILATMLTTTLQTKYQKLVTPSKAAIVISFEPIFAAIIAFFLLNEKISNFGVVGCIFIFTGLLISELMEKK